jgi:proteasome beta subunit
MGVLEDEYKENMSLEEAKELIKRAIKAALARDAASGGDVDLLVISKEGTKTEIVTLT